MANTVTNIMPKILARGLLALREQAIMPRVVNLDYSNEAAQRGDTIDVPIPSALTVAAVSPSNTPPAPADSSPTKVQISLDQWYEANFHMTDKEMVEVDRNDHFVPMQMSEAVKALANKINTTVHSAYTGVYGFAGTAGTTPFASAVSAATDARKVLNQQLCPRTDRRMILDFDAEANALALDAFNNVNEVGGTGPKIDGEIG
ncbi:MAG: P22 phage major capsid protein family protein, partial [Paracoccaceae bacterium]